MRKDVLHQMIDLVLEKEPESGVTITVSAIGSGISVWIMEVDGENIVGTEKHYTLSKDDDWLEWTDEYIKRVRTKDVVGAIRDA